MKWLILSAGKPALAFARAGRDEYIHRIEYFSRLTQVSIKASTPDRESREFLAKSDGHFRVVLDERGKSPTSRQFADLVKTWQLGGKPVAIILGGANGHDPSLVQSADFLWSLGPATLQHELALVVALEQIYRAHTIIAGHPYHRD